MLKNVKEIKNVDQKIKYKNDTGQIIDIDENNVNTIYEDIVLEIQKLEKNADPNNAGRLKYLKTIEGYIEKDYKGKLPNKIFIKSKLKK